MAIFYTRRLAEMHGRANMRVMWRVVTDLDDVAHPDPEIMPVEYWVPEADNPNFIHALAEHASDLIVRGYSVNVTKLRVN